MYYADVQTTDDPTKYYRQYFFTEDDRDEWLDLVKSYGFIVLERGFEEKDNSYNKYK